MGDLVQFPNSSSTVTDVLASAAARAGKFQAMVVVGFTEDRHVVCYWTNSLRSEFLWMLEAAKLELLEMFSPVGVSADPPDAG